MAAQDYFNRVYFDACFLGANHIQASLAAAQSGLETGWGMHVKGNSYFGIKAGRSWEGKTVSFTTHENINGKRKKMVAEFRAYDNSRDSLKGYMETMAAKWPAAWNADNLRVASDGLAKGKHGRYATDPNYSEKIFNTMKRRANKASAAYGASPELEPKPKLAKANPASKILPLYRPKQTDEITLAVLEKFDRWVPADRRADKVKVLVVRGYYENSMGRKGANDRAIYDDAFFIVSPDGIQSFNGNSDPSSFRKRIATIKANQAVRYKPGPHGHRRKNGPYPAFRQDADCIVLRDGAGEDFGMHHVNLHRGGVNGTSSAGCLTIPPHQWKEFHGLLFSLLELHGQPTFFATVVEYAGGNPPVTVPVSGSGSAAKTSLLVGGAVIVSAALETFSGWLSASLSWIGDLI